MQYQILPEITYLVHPPVQDCTSFPLQNWSSWHLCSSEHFQCSCWKDWRHQRQIWNSHVRVPPLLSSLPDFGCLGSEYCSLSDQQCAKEKKKQKTIGKLAEYSSQMVPQVKSLQSCGDRPLTPSDSGAELACPFCASSWFFTCALSRGCPEAFVVSVPLPLPVAYVRKAASLEIVDDAGTAVAAEVRRREPARRCMGAMVYAECVVE